MQDTWHRPKAQLQSVPIRVLTSASSNLSTRMLLFCFNSFIIVQPPQSKESQTPLIISASSPHIWAIFPRLSRCDPISAASMPPTWKTAASQETTVIWFTILSCRPRQFSCQWKTPSASKQTSFCAHLLSPFSILLIPFRVDSQVHPGFLCIFSVSFYILWQR